MFEARILSSSLNAFPYTTIRDQYRDGCILLHRMLSFKKEVENKERCTDAQLCGRA